MKSQPALIRDCSILPGSTGNHTVYTSMACRIHLALLLKFSLVAMFVFSTLFGGSHATTLFAADYALHTFDRQQLTDVYFSEGANAGDLNGDEVADVVYGPYWFEGPTYEKKHAIYDPQPQNRDRYADNFFSWVHDFNGDGANDVFVVGFPGTPAFVYENPNAGNAESLWKKHEVFDWVSNESPQFVNLVGDERPELVCTRDGFFGYATIDWDRPFDAWKFHEISEKITATKFGHGLGVGDVNGDGLMDVLHSKGWFAQPATESGGGRWVMHEVSFSSAYGGAEMYAYDVDGDGDNDVITSEAAHDFGLCWYEQLREDDEVAFQRHLIMGSHPSRNHYGVLFSELHSVNLADIDGDGLKDIVTGKTFYSHHQKSPMWDAGAVVYWFRLVRTDEGVDWIPYRADADAGIGRQVSVIDINGDALLDIVVGGMKGAHVLTHKKTEVDKAAWAEAQPQVYQGPSLPSTKGAKALRGPKAPILAKTGRVAGALEGESLAHRASAGEARSQAMAKFKGDRWSGDSQLWWTGGRPGDHLELDLPEKSGTVDVEIVLTCAKDYAIVLLSLDGQPLGEPIDLFNADVITTGVLTFPKIELKSGTHKLTAQIVGANPKALKGYMFAVDYVRLKAEGEKFPEPDDGIKATDASGRVLNLDFETGTLADWTAVGEAFAGQPIKGDAVAARRTDMRSGHRGEFWIGGFEKLKDPPTGTLTSAAFEVTQPYATFLTNGGSLAETRVELIRHDTGNVFFKITGRDSDVMRQVVVDLRGHLGKQIQIRVVDEHRGPWGHLNFDHFRLHETRPARLTPPLIQLVDDDYPHAGLAAEEAALAMTMPKGFTAIVGAAEPDVQQPIAMAIDDRGRVWIAEAYEYPIRAKGDTGRDRVLIFEDTNGDGQLDSRKVFAEGLNLVSGLEVGFGGVWVGAAPYLLFIPDRNGDDVPDAEPQRLLDGWGYQDTHETLNAFIWGPDGWLYGCHGVFTHSRVGKPGTPDEERIPLNAAIWRYHPVRHEFDVFCHGTSNPWGVDFNDHGQAFATACVIPHLYHMIQGARYQRQGGQHFNPHTYRDITTIADHLHYLGATPHGGNSKSDAAGGGHAHAGAMIYLGSVWPEQYRDQLFMNNIHGQRLNMDVLRPQGSGYTGSHGPDFLLTADKASQILNLRYGPDGQAWMIDWYDMQACHRRESSVHDRSNGRIYKIAYGELAHVEVDLQKLGDRELAELVLHDNDWYVRHSRRILQERSASRAINPDATEHLVEIATSHEDDTRRLRAAWGLHVTGDLDEAVMARLLVDPSAFVRGWTIQLAMEQQEGDLSTPLLEQFTEMANQDDSPVVRLYLASALQRMPHGQRWSILDGLTSHAADASDHNLSLMYWYAAEPLADEDQERALAFGLSAGQQIPVLRDFMLRRIGSSDAAKSLGVLVAGLDKAKEAGLQLTYLKAIRTALRGRRQVAAPNGWKEVYTDIARSENADVRLQATALGVTFGDQAAMSALRELIATESAGVDARGKALESLLAAKDAQLVPTLHKLISEPAMRQAALRGLAQYDDPKTANVLLAAYPGLSPSQRRSALGTLCSRVPYGIALLNAIDNKKVPGTDLTADLVRQLQYLKNETIEQQLRSVWGSVRDTSADKAKLIATYKTMLAMPGKGDLNMGRAVFAKTCQNCHTLYGVGKNVGPDLTGSNRSNLDYLLSNIVDPSAVMAKEYRSTVIVTTDGRVVTGLVQDENNIALTVQTADAIVIVPKVEIDERELSAKSMMPDNQLQQFSKHQIRSLIAYVTAKQQVPMLATRDNAALLFNGQDLTGWSGDPELWSVEDGEIVGRSSGLRHNNWIVSHLMVRDFRLKLEVKLIENAGNSGIQFRSQARGREVGGYQADIGAGWWGKLYEEHGRAMLWDTPGEQHVKPNDWNRYEIIARGSKIQTLINDQLCVDLDDPAGKRQGIIAFQLHSGGKTEVRYRNLSLEVLGPEVESVAGE